MTDSVITASLDRQPESLLWRWHQCAYEEACQAFRDGDFPRMHHAYSRLSAIRAELDIRFGSIGGGSVDHG